MIKGADLDSLRAAVLANPEDDALRAVWGDALLEAGDARGALIQAQLAPPSQKRDLQVAALIRKHGRALLGELAAVLMAEKHLVFDRGLLSACAIATDSRKKIGAVVGNPVWATVRSIYFRNYSGGSLTPFEEDQPHPAVALLLDASLASLEVALGLGLGDVFGPLCASQRPLALREVFVLDYDQDDEMPARLRRQIVDSRALPRLRRLGMEGMPPKWLLAAAWAKKLDSIVCTAAALDIGDQLAFVERNAPSVKTFVLRPDWVFENGFDRPQWIYTFTKKGKRFDAVAIEGAHATPSRQPEAKAKQAIVKKLPKHLALTERA